MEPTRCLPAGTSGQSWGMGAGRLPFPWLSLGECTTAGYVPLSSAIASPHQTIGITETFSRRARDRTLGHSPSPLIPNQSVLSTGDANLSVEDWALLRALVSAASHCHRSRNLG